MPLALDDLRRISQPAILNSRDEGAQILNFRDHAISATPHWDNFLTNLSVAADDDHRRDFIDFIHRHCFQEDLLWKNSSGDWLDHKMPLALKMETLFETAWQRRALALEHINGNSNVAVTDHTYELSSEQMQELSQLQLPARGMLIVWAMGRGSGLKNGASHHWPQSLEHEMQNLKPGEA